DHARRRDRPPADQARQGASRAARAIPRDGLAGWCTADPAGRSRGLDAGDDRRARVAVARHPDRALATDMAHDARWWLERLRAMSPAEVIQRGVRLTRDQID